tara:strand:+ start:10770 stop:11030 length:261 start_codon:yes stop_codon:yes gene_type:complete
MTELLPYILNLAGGIFAANIVRSGMGGSSVSVILLGIIGGLIGGFIGDILGFNISHDTLILAALEDFLKGGLGGALCLGSVRMLVR